MPTDQPTVQAIYRYPVKGLSPEVLERAGLAVGATLVGDRAYAIENGPSGFDPAAPAHLPKIRFLMLMRNERLATLRSHYDDATHTLVIEAEGREAARGDLSSATGRAAIEAFFANFCAADLRGPPRVLQAADFSFSDVAKKGGFHHQSRLGRRDRNRDRHRRPSAALSRQCLCRGLAGLARIRPAGPGDRDRAERAAESRQADRALRRHRCRSRHRHPRSGNPKDA